jgi:NADPH-dependent curcumin reductase CurA
MTGSVNRHILLKSRPEGAPSLDNFELTEAPIPEPGDGEVLMRTIYLSLDPYMRGRRNATRSYAAPAALGQPMVGGTVGEIVSSQSFSTLSRLPLLSVASSGCWLKQRR